ncbi:hypothetical protein BKA65DRAFT_352818, partial [Rhexocercosporidium sp. MPI-PUGE-AT-0058]
ISSLANDALFAESKPLMDFLNPWLYSGGSKTFPDMISGSASVCNTTGFSAPESYDAVTGFVTPFFPE